MDVGAKLGPYEIVSPLGAGGMGEVYRARDTRLDRDVAVKVLPARLAGDPQFKQRFEREARTVSSLNHPHICTLYDIGREGETDFLVMEYLEGETLAERLKRGPLLLAELVKIGMQISDALDKAHRKSVVHRDLKPGNIMLTKGGAKLMDFGLAKPTGVGGMAGSGSAPLLSAAMTADGASPGSPLTTAGTLVGTIQYMSPEQIEGKEADARSDIFAFGSTLYEMATGERAFLGKSQLSVASAILEKEPEPIRQKQPLVPAALGRVVGQCLAKDPDERFQSAYDVGLELKWVGTTPAEEKSSIAQESARQASPVRRILPWALAATAVLFAAFAGWLLLQPKPGQRMVQFSVAAPENSQFQIGGETALSPDGRYLAFVAQKNAGGNGVLWVRPLDSLKAREIPGTEGIFGPFWSPDSRWIGFTTSNELKKVSVSDGAPQTLCDMHGPGSGTWNRDGVILFSSGSGLYRVPDTGGKPTLVAVPDAARNQAIFSFPQFLPDGRHFVVLISMSTSGQSSMATGSLDSKTVEPLAQVGSEAVYTPPGDLLYLQQGTLMARPFSTGKLRFTGPAVPVAQNVGSYENYPLGYFSVSSAGVLAYLPGLSANNNTLTWLNRAGQKLGTVGKLGSYANPALSPDGTTLAVQLTGPEGAGSDIWVFDLKRGTGSRLTFTPAQNSHPAWSHDGSWIYFESNRGGKAGIYRKPANGLGNTQKIFQAGFGSTDLEGLSPDGRYALYFSGPAMVVLPLSGDGKPFIFKSHGVAFRGVFSPNGRYVAYVSTETGRTEVYVQTFPKLQGRWQISTAGGDAPMWRSDGKELFYEDPNNELMSVSVNTGSKSFEAGTPKLLFQTRLMPLGVGRRNNYVPSSDGQRFLTLEPVGQAEQSPITVVTNWQALLKKQ